MTKTERKDARRGILANFQFRIDGNSEEVFNGMTTDVSSEGFGFLTETIVTEGQTITITKHSLGNFSGRKARVIWVKKKTGCLEVGAELYPVS